MGIRRCPLYPFYVGPRGGADEADEADRNSDGMVGHVPDSFFSIIRIHILLTATGISVDLRASLFRLFEVDNSRVGCRV